MQEVVQYRTYVDMSMRKLVGLQRPDQLTMSLHDWQTSAYLCA